MGCSLCAFFNQILNFLRASKLIKPFRLIYRLDIGMIIFSER